MLCAVSTCTHSTTASISLHSRGHFRHVGSHTSWAPHAPVGAVLAVVKDRYKRLAAKRAGQHGGVLPDWLLQLQLCPASDALHEEAGQARWA